VYKIVLLVFLLLSGCTAVPKAGPDYGEAYFELDCVWVDPQVTVQPAIWRCFEEVETGLINGFLYLELESDISLYFCGENLTLSTGIDIYDNLISFITTDRYNCLHITEDKQKENEFDWSWEASINQLQIIWRPEEQSHKMITMIIEDADYNVVVRTIVYYKII